MSNSKEYIKNLDIEKSIFDEIKSYVDSKDMMIYNAGAGAGKTYDLIRTINYIIENSYSSLENDNNKVLCITFTNASKDEVIKRLGSTSFAHVSTIHDLIWDIIKNYPMELLTEHKFKIEMEITENNKIAELYNELVHLENKKSIS